MTCSNPLELLLHLLLITLCQAAIDPYTCREELQPQRFVSSQLKPYRDCTSVSIDLCDFVHEAVLKCECICARLYEGLRQPVANELSAVGIDPTSCQEEGERQRFESGQMFNYESCAEVTLRQCNFVHEARVKCECICEKLKYRMPVESEILQPEPETPDLPPDYNGGYDPGLEIPPFIPEPEVPPFIPELEIPAGGDLVGGELEPPNAGPYPGPFEPWRFRHGPWERPPERKGGWPFRHDSWPPKPTYPPFENYEMIDRVGETTATVPPPPPTAPVTAPPAPPTQPAYEYEYYYVDEDIEAIEGERTRFGGGPEYGSEPRTTFNGGSEACEPGPTCTDAGSNALTRGLHCFHGNDSVQTEIGRMPIADLLTNAQVKVLAWDRLGDKPVYAPVIYWLHADSSLKTQFLLLKTESNQSISITHSHLIYRSPTCDNSDMETVLAEKISIGDCLLSQLEGRLTLTRVVSIDVEQKSGIYAPVTTYGSIVVNDIVASCYVHQEDETLQKMLFSYIAFVRDILNCILPSAIVNTLFGGVPDVARKSVKISYVYHALETLQKYFVTTF